MSHQIVKKKSQYQQLIRQCGSNTAVGAQTRHSLAIIQCSWNRPLFTPSLIWDILLIDLPRASKNILEELCRYILTKPNVDVYHTNLHEEDNGLMTDYEKSNFVTLFRYKTAHQLWRFIYHNRWVWWGDYNVFPCVKNLIFALQPTPECKINPTTFGFNISPSFVNALNQCLETHAHFKFCRWVRGARIAPFKRCFHIEEKFTAYRYKEEQRAKKRVMEGKKRAASFGGGGSNKRITRASARSFGGATQGRQTSQPLASPQRNTGPFDFSTMIDLMNQFDREMDQQEEMESDNSHNDTNSYAYTLFHKWVQQNVSYCTTTIAIDNIFHESSTFRDKNRFRDCLKIIIKNIKTFTSSIHPEVRNELAGLEYLACATHSIRPDVEDFLYLLAIHTLKDFLFLKFGTDYGLSFFHSKVSFLFDKRGKKENTFQNEEDHTLYSVFWAIDENGNFVCKLNPFHSRAKSGFSNPKSVKRSKHERSEDQNDQNFKRQIRLPSYK